MQKISIRHDFDCSLEMLLRAREERYRHLDKFPELKNVTIIADETEGATRIQKRRISIAESIPPVLAALLPGDSAALIEDSRFDLNTNTHTFTITPGEKQGSIFSIRGRSEYFSESDGRSSRSYDLEIKSAAFLIGLVVETAVSELYRHSLEKDRKSIEEYIGVLREKNHE